MKKQFIKATEAHCTFDQYVAAPYFRKFFTLEGYPESAEISVCGLGFYRLFVNGTEITKGALAPYISNPDLLCYYDVYQIEHLLHEGKNSIGVLLGNGFFNNFGGGIWDFDKAPWVGAPCLALEFQADCQRKKVFFHADETFKTHPSPIYFNDLRMGICYDANQETENWNHADFDDSCWSSAMVAAAPRGEMKRCEAEPIRVTCEKKPVSVVKSGNGYLYDFGENNAGVCKLRIQAEKNQKITLVHGEVLKNGKLDMDNLIPADENHSFEAYRPYKQKDIYISKGVGTEEFIPCFTYHGFRYVYVEGITDEQATEELLTYQIMSSDLREIGGFSSSSQTINTLYDMAKRSDISNFYYFSNDCPHREKNGWTGDASISADHLILTYDVEKSWRTWLENIRLSQSPEGALPGIVPTGGWGFEWGNGPLWDSVLFNLPYQLFQKRGNLDIIRENAHAMMRYLDYIVKQRNADGTISIGLGDWVPVGKFCEDYDAPLALTDSVMVMDMARKAAQMFESIEYHHQANFAKAVYTDFYEIIRTNLIDLKTMTAAGNCQSSQAICLYYGIFKEEEKQMAFQRLLAFIHEKNDTFDCGMLGMHTLFHVLSEYGEGELAYHMITRPDYPSYANLIERGETTIPEHFLPEGALISHNHHLFCDINRWFVERLAGLKVLNFNAVKITPDFIEKIHHASAYYELPAGRVEVQWSRETDGILLNVCCPKAVHCELDLDMEKQKVTYIRTY